MNTDYTDKFSQVLYFAPTSRWYGLWYLVFFSLVKCRSFRWADFCQSPLYACIGPDSLPASSHRLFGAIRCREYPHVWFVSWVERPQPIEICSGWSNLVARWRQVFYLLVQIPLNVGDLPKKHHPGKLPFILLFMDSTGRKHFFSQVTALGSIFRVTVCLIV